MSILSTISRGKRPRHIFARVYGTDGVGNSTLCSHTPNPIFVGAEKGTEQLDVARFPQTESISELFAQPVTLQTEKHEFQMHSPEMCNENKLQICYFFLRLAERREELIETELRAQMKSNRKKDRLNGKRCAN